MQPSERPRIKRPAFAVACAAIGVKLTLVLLPDASAPLWSWIPWLAIAGVVWIEEPRWRES